MFRPRSHRCRVLMKNRAFQIYSPPPLHRSSTPFPSTPPLYAFALHLSSSPLHRSLRLIFPPPRHSPPTPSTPQVSHKPSASAHDSNSTSTCGLQSALKATTGALIVRIGFWGLLYSNSNKEPPKPILIITLHYRGCREACRSNFP